MSPMPTADTQYIVMPGMTTWVAFLAIADLLDLRCGFTLGFNIKADPKTLPPSLQPTSRQQTVPHLSYVDMMPWSTTRDRILISQTALNGAELINDLTNGELKIWGTAPWDPISWEVSPNIAHKWWFLFDHSMINASNFWRSQRGEPPMSLDIIDQDGLQNVVGGGERCKK
jgi:hypothetical protein